MYSIPRFYTCLKPTAFQTQENKCMVTSGEGEAGSTGVGELEGQTTGCKMGSRKACIV